MDTPKKEGEMTLIYRMFVLLTVCFISTCVASNRDFGGSNVESKDGFEPQKKRKRQQDSYGQAPRLFPGRPISAYLKRMRVNNDARDIGATEPDLTGKGGASNTQNTQPPGKLENLERGQGTFAVPENKDSDNTNIIISVKEDDERLKRECPKKAGQFEYNNPYYVPPVPDYSPSYTGGNAGWMENKYSLNPPLPSLREPFDRNSNGGYGPRDYPTPYVSNVLAFYPNYTEWNNGQRGYGFCYQSPVLGSYYPVYTGWNTGEIQNQYRPQPSTTMGYARGASEETMKHIENLEKKLLELQKEISNLEEQQSENKRIITQLLKGQNQLPRSKPKTKKKREYSPEENMFVGHTDKVLKKIFLKGLKEASEFAAAKRGFSKGSWVSMRNAGRRHWNWIMKGDSRLNAKWTRLTLTSIKNDDKREKKVKEFIDKVRAYEKEHKLTQQNYKEPPEL